MYYYTSDPYKIVGPADLMSQMKFRNPSNQEIQTFHSNQMFGSFSSDWKDEFLLIYQEHINKQQIYKEISPPVRSYYSLQRCIF